MNFRAKNLAPALASGLALTLALVQPVTAQEGTPAPAAESDGTPAPTEIIRANDPALSCVQIADEAAGLSEAMGGAPDGGLFDSLTNVAKAGAATFIPGAGLVIAGADALTQPDRNRREVQANAIAHRWYYLNGLYAGLKCQQQAERMSISAAEQGPSSVPPAQPAPVARPQ